jgi:hypothetical protein
MRILMAHGTMVGKEPDVIAGLKKYNIIIPMQNNRDTRTIIQGYLRRNKVIRIIKY